MAYSANGSIFSFPSTAATISTITSVDFANNTAAIDISTMSAGEKKYEAGKQDPEFTVELNSHTTLLVGATGIATIDWNSGGTDTIDCVLTAIATNGGIDSPVTTSLTFKPTTS